MHAPPPVIVYTDRLLPTSATFIREQAEALRAFEPYYVGLRKVEGLALPEARTMVVNQGGNIGLGKEALWYITGLPGFIRRVAAIKPKLIHAHFGPDGINGLVLARKLKVPLIVTFHGYDVTVKDEFARKSFYRHRVYLRHRDLLKREASCFIAVSKFIEKEMLAKDFPQEKIIQHYIGIDLDRFQPDLTVEREPIILFVGRLVEKKGGEYLIRAASETVKAHPQVRVVIIGDGPLRQDLEKLASTLACPCEFMGFQPPDVVRQWLNRASVFCVPSLIATSGDAEAFGMVFAEAQAMGTPVVSFSSGGLPEVVIDQETGFLAPERDWQALARAQSLLLENEGLWAQFSQAGRKHVCAHFDLHRQTPKLEQIYKQFIEKQ